MKTGLLFGVAVIVLAGTVVGGVADVWAACVPTRDCTTLGYKYTAAQCNGKGVACPFDTTLWSCVLPAPAEGYCCGHASQCGMSGTSNTNDSYCQGRWGKSCYRHCREDYGASDCEDMWASCRAQGGTPVFQQCYTYDLYYNFGYGSDWRCEMCSFSETKESCAAQCKAVGTNSCTKNGTTYYESCGASTCKSGQTCQNGTCKMMC